MERLFLDFFQRGVADFPRLVPEQLKYQVTVLSLEPFLDLRSVPVDSALVESVSGSKHSYFLGVNI